jgi:glyoxylase I family protein
VKIAHIALSVSNIERSLNFYSKHFGFKCTEKFEIKSAGLKIYILKKDNASFELFEFKNHKPLPKYRKNLDSDLKTLGAKHFAFEVLDAQEAYNKFKKAKVKFATDILIFGNGLEYFFIKDPDGILVEIMEAR